ncbi:aminotransferase-like domain-containing protein [Chelatococcus reniformis]|uniref:aminotransferase-like domain-containing protein n=1 Tax=Chelatococcus reniformis TaxID=1494448 RepID=UPI001AED3A55|nr:PLP-dependent aminotransferase family protein [Chelatococcus reniformis]
MIGPQDGSSAAMGTADVAAGSRPVLQKPQSFQRILGDWRQAEGALYARLATALRTALVHGDIAPGMLLPPERSLAQILRVSRTTVVSAYRALREEGWLDSRQGSGHLVRHPQHAVPQPYVNSDVVKAMARNPMLRPLSPQRSGAVDFSVSRQASIGPLLREVTLGRAAALDDLPASSGYQPLGLAELREAVARYVTGRGGLPTQPDQILITSGAQQAIWLVGQLYAPHGERVVLENPTYPGAIDAFRMLGAHIEPLPVHPDGFVLDGLGALLKSARPRLVLVSPTCHAPTGLVMPHEQRLALVEQIDEHQVTLVDDQTMLDLLVGEDRPVALAQISPTAPILSIGSLSKLFWPGLRVGWIRAPQPIIEHLARLKAVADMGGSPIVQSIAAGLLDHADTVRQRRHQEITRSLDVLCEAMDRLLPDWTWRRPAGGLSFWAGLPAGTATEFAQVALLHGVTVVAGSALTSDGSGDDHVRLQFVQDSEAITLGVRRLAQAWQAYAGQRPARRPPAVALRGAG